jgi:hypothetical protein
MITEVTMTEDTMSALVECNNKSCDKTIRVDPANGILITPKGTEGCKECDEMNREAESFQRWEIGGRVAKGGYDTTKVHTFSIRGTAAVEIPKKEDK